MAIVANSTHIATARARLLEQFKGQERLRAFLDAFVQRVQDIDDAAIATMQERWLANAEGEQLDQIGALVGIERGLRTDGPYRDRIDAQIYLNRSHGSPEDLLTLAAFIVGGATDVLLEELFPASFRLTVDEVVPRYAPNEVRDSGPNTLHGRPFGDVSLIDSPFGDSFKDAYDFDGTDDYISIGAGGTGLSGTFTIEAKVRAAGSPFGKLVARAGNTAASENYYLEVDDSSRFSVSVRNGAGALVTIAEAGSVTAGTEYDVAATYDGTTLRLFKDGVIAGAALVASLQAPDTVTPLEIGRRAHTTFPDYFKGVIEEVRISDVARYTLAYTPATDPFTSDADTVALYHLDGVSLGEDLADVILRGKPAGVGASVIWWEEEPVFGFNDGAGPHAGFNVGKFATVRRR